MDTNLETERLLLRPWREDEDDIDAGLRLWGDPLVMVHVGAPLSREQVARGIRAGAAHLERHGTQHWAMVDKASGQVVGCCGLNRFDEGPAFELVFHLMADAWGKGLATEAGRAAIADGFERLAIPRIIASHHPDNDGSRRVLEKLDFRFVEMRFWEDVGQEELTALLRQIAAEDGVEVYATATGLTAGVDGAFLVRAPTGVPSGPSERRANLPTWK